MRGKGMQDNQGRQETLRLGVGENGDRKIWSMERSGLSEAGMVLENLVEFDFHVQVSRLLSP